MDVLLELLALGVASLVLVVFDTYFWVRTTLRLRTWANKIEPRLPILDAIGERFGFTVLQTDAVDPSSGAPAQRVNVLRAKNGRPYIQLAGGASRFLSEDQAKALARGVPTAVVLGPVPGGEVPRGSGVPALASSLPVGLAQPDGSDGAGARDLDYAGMAAELGAPEEAVRAFVAKHSNGGGAGGGGPPGPTDAPPAAEGGATMELLRKLAGGELDKDAAAAAARETLAGIQLQQRAGPDGTIVGSGGVSW